IQISAKSSTKKSAIFLSIAPDGASLAFRVDGGRDLDWALPRAGTIHSFEFDCGNFRVAQLFLRARHGKRRCFPCTAADLHSRVVGSYTLQRWKDLGPG